LSRDLIYNTQVKFTVSKFTWNGVSGEKMK